MNSELRSEYLKALGIPQWVARAARADSPGDAWSELGATVRVCTRCGLSNTRTHAVFGSGPRRADWLIVGDAPGPEEDIQGEPFQGRAGQLLVAMLRAIGLAREEVFLTNVLKCRPPANRDATAAEAAECLPYLERQIEELQPKILLAVGRLAAQQLLQTELTLGSLRQKAHAFGVRRLPMIVTFHPGYLLSTPADKRKTWEDLKFAREVLRRG